MLFKATDLILSLSLAFYGLSVLVLVKRKERHRHTSKWQMPFKYLNLRRKDSNHNICMQAGKNENYEKEK